MKSYKQFTEGTIQPNGTDKIDPACVEVAPKKKTEKEMEDQQNESFTFDSAALAKQELADAKNKKHRRRGKVANLLRKLGMKEEVEQIDEIRNRDDAYTRDYKSSVAGMGSHKHSAAYHADGGANDEGWGDEHRSHKPRSMMDRPHTVHIGGKPWKKFSSGHQAHAAARTLKNKGKDAVAIAHHNEETEMSNKPKSLREFIETIQEAKPVNVDKVNAAGQAPHEEKWEAAKKPAVKKESFTAEELLVALKEGMWPGTPEYKAKFENQAKQGGGSGVKKGSRYGGSLQKPDNDNDSDDAKPETKKNK